MENELLGLISRLKLFKVTKWQEDSSIVFTDERNEATITTGANVSSSVRTDYSTPQHALLLDIDLPAWLIPSSTPGHSHLFIDVAIPEQKYFKLLHALAEAGVIQDGYAGASVQRGGTSLRLP